jgi:PelA/Pel-15E family pectate lyase
MRFVNVVLLSALVMTPVSISAGIVGRQQPAEPISAARIARLPSGQQAEWAAYLRRSDMLMAADKAQLAAERRGQPAPPLPTKGPSGSGGMPLDRDPAWYTSPEARHAADNILSFQTPAGGWGKNADRSGALRLPGQSFTAADVPGAAADIGGDSHWAFVGTIDNGATTSELRFLARVQQALPGAEGDRYRAAFAKGVRYLLAAQFPNGGWPQVFPLQGGYHDAVTFNDNAVVDVVLLLGAVADRQGDYGFVPADLAAAAGAAVARGLAVVLASQVVIDGKRMIWGQQHDALTLAPVGARNFEPRSLSSDESAALLIFLMRRRDPSPALIAAVRDGVAWLRAHALHGVEWTRGGPDGRRLVAKQGAGPLWARFYDIDTGKPVFGDRDRSIHDDVNEISLERRNGYSWFGTGPKKALDAYAKWAPLHGLRAD